MSSPPLDRVAEAVAGRFAGDRRLQSFGALLEQFARDPYPLARNAAQYTSDAIAHFGSTEVPGIGGSVTRWRMFDGDREAGVVPLIGHEEAQQAVVETMNAAAREGRMDRMIVLHGPNGSGKSSLVELLQWGLEGYSHTPEGALYALRWIFPKTPAEGASLGFGGAPPSTDLESYAHLGADDVAARIVCELRCNPLFVIPDSQRGGVLESALEQAPQHRSKSFRHLLTGNLCPRCKEVYEALLAAHQGDWAAVVRHVQVERVFVSRRFRIGAVVTQPQGTADAQLHMLARDAAVAGLPPFLRSVPLFEVLGDLPDANRGLLEFSDFLKRNLELSKYLLQTTEKGFVTVGNKLIDLDIVFAATVNERHLEAFKHLPEFPSFQARMAFVRVPYLREIGRETQVYTAVCDDMGRSRHVAPHLARYCALFAVLTRLERPQTERHDEDAADLVSGLTPLEKAWLYADGRIPDRLDAGQARELRRILPALRDEYLREAAYEGRVGASVREVRAALTRAAVRDESNCVSPSALHEEFADTTADTSRYRFLQVDADGAYHDVPALLEAATRELARWILMDVQDAMALVSEDEYDRRFDAYFQHVVASVQGQSVRDPNTGERVPPDVQLMESVERRLPTGDGVEGFRRDLVSRIGAYAVDHPSTGAPDFRKLFPDLLRSMRRSFFDERRDAVTRVQRHVLVYGSPDFDDLPESDRRTALRTIENLTGEGGAAGKGYCLSCAKDAVDFALVHLDDTP